MDLDTRHGIIILPIGGGFVIRYKDYAILKEDQAVLDKLPKELKQPVQQAMMNKQPVRVAERTCVFSSSQEALLFVDHLLQAKKAMMKDSGELVELHFSIGDQYAEKTQVSPMPSTAEGPSGISL
jgi:hypothetical protein